MATANITTPTHPPRNMGGLDTVLVELDAAIGILSRQPEEDTAATAAMIHASTARAVLRDALAATAPASDKPRDTATHGVICTSSILFELWKRAAPSLDRESLEWFAGATEYGGHIATCLQKTVEGMGCLIEQDGSTGSVGAGNFQSARDVPQLLFLISSDLDNINALLQVGDSASYRLRKHEEAAP